jgi:VWFA-related protein
MRTHMPRLIPALITALAIITAMPLASQQPPPAKPSEPSFFSETIEVRVINVDVMVTDRAGKPVAGLTKNDFELFENGQKREITNFLEMKAPQTTVTLVAKEHPATPQPAAKQPEASADARSRKIVLFIDNSTLQHFNRQRVLAAAKDFVREIMRPNDQAMVVTWSPGLEIKLPFTNDINAVMTVLDSVTGESAHRALAAYDRVQIEHEMRAIPEDFKLAHQKLSKDPATSADDKPPIEMGLELARSYAAQAQHEQHEVAEALKGVIASIRGVEGRRSLVFISERLDELPGKAIFDTLEQLKDFYLNGNQANFASEANAYRDPDLVPSITRLANSAGVTIYPMHAAGLAGDTGSISSENLGMEAQGLTRAVKPMNSSYVTMQRVAADTGGVALLGSNNFKLGFETVANDLTTYYSLGFSASGEQKDAVRTLGVKLKNPKGLIVRARTELVEKSLTSEMNDAVSANLFFPITRNDLNIRMTAGQPKPAAEERIEIPVDIVIPTALLTLVPEGTDLTGHFSTFITFVRKDGATAKVVRQEQALRFPADSLKRRKEITVRTAAVIDTKTEAISVGVMDGYSHAAGFAMIKLTVPVPPPAG